MIGRILFCLWVFAEIIVIIQRWGKPKEIEISGPMKLITTIVEFGMVLGLFYIW